MPSFFNICITICNGKQAALHGLANIAGKTRSEDKIILNADAEESLRHLIYEVASRSSKLTPSVSSMALSLVALIW